MSQRFYLEMRRHYYTTPSSYLELIKLFLALLDKKQKETSGQRDRIANGLQVYKRVLVFKLSILTIINLLPFFLVSSTEIV